MSWAAAVIGFLLGYVIPSPLFWLAVLAVVLWLRFRRRVRA